MAVKWRVEGDFATRYVRTERCDGVSGTMRVTEVFSNSFLSNDSGNVTWLRRRYWMFTAKEWGFGSGLATVYGRIERIYGVSGMIRAREKFSEITPFYFSRYGAVARR